MAMQVAIIAVSLAIIFLLFLAARWATKKWQFLSRLAYNFGVSAIALTVILILADLIVILGDLNQQFNQASIYGIPLGAFAIIYTIYDTIKARQKR